MIREVKQSGAMSSGWVTGTLSELLHDSNIYPHFGKGGPMQRSVPSSKTYIDRERDDDDDAIYVNININEGL